MGDHKVSDAGFYDLLLHSQDRAYTITDLNEALENAGLELAAPTQPLLYDPRPLLAPDVQVPMGMRQVEQMALAEKLRGTFKTHVIYARPKGAVIAPPLGQEDAIPHFRGGAPAQLAQVVGKTGGLKINDVGIEMRLSLPKAAAPIIARADGTRSLAELRADIGLSPSAFAAAWTPVERALSALGLMHHSTLLRG